MKHLIVPNPDDDGCWNIDSAYLGVMLSARGIFLITEDTCLSSSDFSVIVVHPTNHEDYESFWSKVVLSPESDWCIWWHKGGEDAANFSLPKVKELWCAYVDEEIGKSFRHLKHMIPLPYSRRSSLKTSWDKAITEDMTWTVTNGGGFFSVKMLEKSSAG
jgi:hypothetical protein